MNILLIDTDRKHLENSRNVFQAFHYIVDCALSLDAALLKMQTTHFDLVILDLEFPPQLVDEFMPVIMTSKSVLVCTIQSPSILKAFKALKMNAKDVIIKPLDFKKISIISGMITDSQVPAHARLKKLDKKNIISLLEGKSH